MKKTGKNKFIYFLLGALLMFLLDFVFHFNNSIEKGFEREAGKVQTKIENIFK